MSPREKLADALMEVDLRTLDYVRMKQERDEARDAIVGWENKWKCAVDMAARAELERDEAIIKYATEATEHMLAVNKLANERDKALEALMKIEDLFIDGTDIYADRENMGTIARNALKETPETEELKCLSLIEVMAIPQERREIALGTLRAIKERNEAMDYSKATWQSLRDSQDEVLRLTFGNRELRNLKNE
jgi:hypothetical protein